MQFWVQSLANPQQNLAKQQLKNWLRYVIISEFWYFILKSWKMLGAGKVLDPKLHLKKEIEWKLENWIISKYGKTAVQKKFRKSIWYQIFIFWPKKVKKEGGRHGFGLGRKMGRNGCRLWKRPKFKKNFCPSLGSSYGYLIAIM